MKTAGISPEVVSAEKFFEAYSRVSLVNHLILEKFKTVLQAFERENIEVLILKGTDLIFRSYGVKGLRPMNDVDLLVHEKDLPAIDRILKNLRYISKIDGNPAYIDPENHYSLDLITDVWYLDNPEEIWRRTTERPCLGSVCKVMSAEDLILYLTAYITVHRGYLRPTYTKDLSLILEGESIEWPLVVERARRAHLKIPVYHGFCFASRGGVIIPDDVITELSPANRSERWKLFLFRKLVNEKGIRGLGHFLLWITRPKKKKGNWLKKVFFPSKPMMHYRYGERNKGMYFFLRGWRIINLGVRAILLLGKIGIALCRRSQKPQNHFLPVTYDSHKDCKKKEFADSF